MCHSRYTWHELFLHFQHAQVINKKVELGTGLLQLGNYKHVPVSI